MRTRGARTHDPYLASGGRWRAVALVVALSGLLGTPAMAGRPIVTPALDAGPGGGLDTFSCTVVNLKPTPVDAVTIELVRADGSTIASVGPVTAHPLDDRYIVWESGEEIAYCRVSSPNPLSRRRTAVTFCLSDDPANGCNGAMVTLP